ncbi:MAG: MmgE/PrpD family protein [Advenella sp.]|nr:MmgE/PrpD family protein [Advenella sp.]
MTEIFSDQRRRFHKTAALAFTSLYVGNSVAATTGSSEEGSKVNTPPSASKSSDAILDLVDYSLALSYEDLPAEVISITKQQLLDTIGVGLAGYNADGVRQLRLFTEENGGKAESLVWGGVVRVPAHEAARVNGAMSHALDYDDTHEKSYVHPSVITIPAVLAIAEKVPGLTGKDLIVAIVLGTDISCRLALAAQPGVNPFKVGWHNTTIYGYISSALAAGKLLGLDREQLIYAAGIAYHQAAGNAQAHVDGALTKRMGPGYACSAGVLAAQMAQLGVTGARDVLEGPIGLYPQYHTGHYARAALLQGLGTQFASSELSFKPYPSCRGSHTAVDAALALMQKYKLQVTDVKSLTIYNGPGEYKLLGDPLPSKRVPQSTVQAQFSNPWVVASTLIKGQLSLADFTQEALGQVDVLAFTQKINTALDESLITRGGGVGPTRITVQMQDGQTITETVLTAKGEPNQPLTIQEFEQKFKDCASSAGLNPVQITSLMSTIQHLEDLTEVSVLMRQMQNPV